MENYVPISFGNGCCSSILYALPAASISTTEGKKKGPKKKKKKVSLLWILGVLIWICDC